MDNLEQSIQEQLVDYNPTTGEYTARYDWSSPEPIAPVVIAAVTAATDAEPTAVDVLYDVVDPDALEALFEPVRANGSRRRGRVTFTLSDCEVTVRSDGYVTVRPPSPSSEVRR